MQNSGLLLAGVCFLERNLQGPIAGCVQSSAMFV